MESRMKCSKKDHQKIDAIKYCKKCEVYMCNQCLEIHSNFLPNHQTTIIGEDLNNSASELCGEENHNQVLEYYCKSHNKLGCALCIIKIKDKKKGQHKDCDICTIEDIKNQKHSQLEQNISKLEQIINSLSKIIVESKELLEKMETDKEQLKIKIQTAFTGLRNALNTREDLLLSQVDELYSITDTTKETEKSQAKIKKCYEKAKTLNKEWNNKTKLYLAINECITIENTMKEINEINERVKSKIPKEYINYKFIPENFQICDFLKRIIDFGEIKKINETKKKEELKAKESKEEEKPKPEEVFPEFIEKLKEQLKIQTKIGDKNEIDIEISGSKTEPKGASIELFSIEQKLFKEYFCLCEEHIKSSLLAFTLNFELKEEKDLPGVENAFEHLKLMIKEIPFYKKYPERYDIFFKNKFKKVSYTFLSRDEKNLKLLLELCVNLSEYIKFLFNIKTDINLNDLLNNSSEEYISKLFNVFVNTKLSGANLKYLFNSIITSLEELKLKTVKKERDRTRLIGLINLIMFFIGIKLKVEYDAGFFKSNRDSIRTLIGYKSMLVGLMENAFRPIMEGMGFRDLFKLINFDCISLSLGIPKYENGLSLVIKMPGLNQYFKDLFK